MIIALSVVAGIFVVVLLLSIVQKVTLASLTKAMTARVAKHCQGMEIVKTDLTAMSFGQTSKGKFQGRGNGALVLTTKEIHFLRAVMPTELTIPLERVTNLSFVHSHLGKATPYRLLKIEFDGEAGEDSIACLVKEPDEFKSEIQRVQSSAAAA